MDKYKMSDFTYEMLTVYKRTKLFYEHQFESM